MRLMALAATLTLLVVGVSPVFAGTICGDGDGDGVDDCEDNCSDVAPGVGNLVPQADTDGDFCGNLCDADYDQDGIIGFVDFGAFTAAFGTADLQKDHDGDGIIGFTDFGFFTANFGGTVGPSGTTSGTTGCP